MKLLCGPVVGLVTASTAHVLVEVDEDANVIMDINEKIGQHQDSETKVMKSRSPTVFVFNNLRPDSNYEIHIEYFADKPLGMCLFL